MANTSEAQNPVDQTRFAMATLAACFVKTFNETDPRFAARFESHLGEAYNQVREMPLSHVGVMETLKWTHEMIQGR